MEFLPLLLSFGKVITKLDWSWEGVLGRGWVCHLRRPLSPMGWEFCLCTCGNKRGGTWNPLHHVHHSTKVHEHRAAGDWVGPEDKPGLLKLTSWKGYELKTRLTSLQRPAAGVSWSLPFRRNGENKTKLLSFRESGVRSWWEKASHNVACTSWETAFVYSKSCFFFFLTFQIRLVGHQGWEGSVEREQGKTSGSQCFTFIPVHGGFA